MSYRKVDSLRQLMGKDAPAIITKLVEQALAGDVNAARLAIPGEGKPTVFTGLTGHPALVTAPSGPTPQTMLESHLRVVQHDQAVQAAQRRRIDTDKSDKIRRRCTGRRIKHGLYRANLTFISG